tara:strand:- start:2725 stop:6123 length:3399 start_codon:yes stop_codon:yes gene_type:complete
MKYSIAASTLKPFSQGNYFIGGGGQSDFGFSPNLGGFSWQSAKYGVLITDYLLIDDPNTLEVPYSDQTIDAIVSADINITGPTGNVVYSGTQLNGGISIETMPINGEYGGGTAFLVYGQIFSDAYDYSNDTNDIMTITISYSVGGIVQSDPITLYHRCGIEMGNLIGYNVGCGRYTDLASGTVVPAVLNMGWMMMDANGYPGGGATLGTRVMFDTPSTFNDPTGLGASISQGNTFYSGALDTGVSLPLITDPNISPFSDQHPDIVNMGAGQQLGFMSMNDDAALPGFVTLSAGTFPPTSNSNCPEFVNYTFFQVSNICEIDANQDVTLGCTDPQACNYDVDANVDNGSCTYTDFAITLNPDITGGGYSENGPQLNNDFWSPISDGSAFVFSPDGDGSQHTVTVSWGAATTQLFGYFGGEYNPFPLDRIEMWVDDGSGTFELHEVVESVSATNTTTDFNGDLNGSSAQVTFQNDVGLEDNQLVQIQFIAYGQNQYLSDEACSAVSNILTTLTPEYIVPGCTDSDATNYNPDATVSDGTCVFCNQASDLFSTVSVNNQATPATALYALDGVTSINLAIPGQAFPTTSATGLISLYLSSELSTADVDSYYNGGAVVLPSSIQDYSFNAAYGTEFNQTFNFSGLEAGVQYTFVVTIPTLSGSLIGTASDCYITSTFTQSYYACTDTVVDDSIEQFVTNLVPETSTVLGDPSLCAYVGECPPQQITLSFSQGDDCTGYLNFLAVGAIPEFSTLVITYPYGNSFNLQDNFGGYVNIETQGSNSTYVSLGTYNFTLTTILPGQEPCVISNAITLTEEDVQVCGCTDPNSTYYNPAATIDNGTCEYAGCMDSTALNYNPDATISLEGGCVYCEYGCTDPEASNYDSAATCGDDNLCEYNFPVFGCTDPQASNYNVLADSGSPQEYCTYPGCTDPNATNYNGQQYTLPDGTQIGPNFNDGTCTYISEVPGCTDPSADNYSEDATVDDGSCLYNGAEGGNITVPTGPVVVVPNYAEFLNHLDICVSQKLTKYYTKLITGQKCDEDVIVQLGMVNTLLKNKKLNCLFDGSKKSIEKLNNLIKFVLTYCDDCKYDLAPEQGNLVGGEDLSVDTQGGIVTSSNNSLVNASSTDFIEPSSNDNITI